MSPLSALISLRKMVRPAPPEVLNRNLSACCWTDDDPFMIVDAWPNPSEAPNPVIVWKVVPPLIVAVLAASAGGPVLTRAAAAASTATGASRNIFGTPDLALPGMTASL